MCARTQFMTDSFLWAERPIMSKTNTTMKHNASATAYYKRVISAICASMDEDIYVFSNSIILFSPLLLVLLFYDFQIIGNFFQGFFIHLFGSLWNIYNTSV